MSGWFITFEGIDGCGKSTQASLLVNHLREKGLEVVHTREPGATTIGQQIRRIFLHSGNMEMGPVTEVLLMAADRADHVLQVVRPALARGATVVCERYVDSTEAYQGFGGQVPREAIRPLNEFATGGLLPDLTLLLDLDPIDAARRRDRDPDRLEAKDREFHKRVRDGYLAIAKENPHRVVMVDASGTTDEVHRRICEIVAGKLSP